jgi:hypothetical protein
MDMIDMKSKRLSEDIGLLFVSQSGRYGMHLHCWIVLIVPESSRGFVLHRFDIDDSFRVMMFRLELEGHRLEAEEDTFFEEVDKLRESEGGR